MRLRWRGASTPAGTVVLASVLLVGCGGAVEPADTPPVLLAEGRVGQQPWRLDGRRTDGRLCTSLVVGDGDEPTDSRCGLRRTPLRHLDAPSIAVDGRLLVVSALPERARRVRIDGADGSLLVEEARDAPGFPGRFFVADLDQAAEPVTVRIFAGGGRPVIP